MSDTSSWKYTLSQRRAAYLNGTKVAGPPITYPWPASSGLPITTYTKLVAGVTINTTTYEMCGLAALYTPASTGKLVIAASAFVSDGTAGDQVNIIVCYGTGAAPAANAAFTGTTTGAPAIALVSTAALQVQTFTETFELTGLTVGTQYWFDFAAKVNAGSGAVFAGSGMTIWETN